MLNEFSLTTTAKTLLSQFSKTVESEVALLDVDGSLICSFGKLPFLCQVIHNKDVQLCKENCRLNEEQSQFSCDGGFMMFSAPVMHNNERIGSLVVRGLKVKENPAGFKVLSEQLGIDIDELEEEYAKMPIFSPDTFSLLDVQVKYIASVLGVLCAEEVSSSRKIQSLSSFQTLHSLLSTTAEFDGVINNVLSFLTTKLPFTHAVIHLSDIKQAYLSSPLSFSRDLIESNVSSSAGDYSQFIPDISSAFSLSAIEGIESVEKSMIAMPILSSGERIALIFCYGEVGLELNDVEQELLEVIKLRFKDIIIKHLQLETAQRTAITDKLTLLFNRRYFNDRLLLELAECRDKKDPISLIMCDLDHFKLLNDTFGHQKGDEVLSIFGKIVSKIVRRSDIACRYGGEEFAVILPSTPLSDAKMVAQRIREEVESHDFGYIEESHKVTVSVGLATCSNGSINASELLKESDAALYRAKNLGRNRVECSLVVDRSLGVINVNDADDLYVQKE